MDVHVGAFGVAQQEAPGEFSGLHPDVAPLSGFSDVKYLTRCFLDWFKQTPAEYRSANRPATLRDNEIEAVAAEATAALIREHRRRVASPTDAPRLSITPILLKNIGSRADLFEKIRKF
jgi:hypothetical protein